MALIATTSSPVLLATTISPVWDKKVKVKLVFIVKRTRNLTLAMG